MKTSVSTTVPGLAGTRVTLHLHPFNQAGLVVSGKSGNRLDVIASACGDANAILLDNGANEIDRQPSIYVGGTVFWLPKGTDETLRDWLNEQLALMQNAEAAA